MNLARPFKAGYAMNETEPSRSDDAVISVRRYATQKFMANAIPALKRLG